MADYDGSPVTLQVAVTGGTADAIDYDLLTTSLSFTANGSQNVFIKIKPDADNLDETIKITITETTLTGIIIVTPVHTINITDDECRIENVTVTALACNGDDAEFTLTWTDGNTSGTMEVDINGNGYQTMTSGGTYTIVDATAVIGAIVTVRDFNENSCLITTTVDVPACLSILPVAFINEFHYDDDGTDDGEFVEIAIESSFSEDLSDFKIILYNGNGGASYKTETGNDLTVGNISGGFTFYTWSVPQASGIQNGNDGIALSYEGTLLEFISYEGTLTATNGDAIGITSTDVGVSESSTGAAGISIQRIGSCSGICPNGLIWTGPTTESPGSVNASQLPVELLYFDAKESNQMSILSWSTATEENNAYFDVQRSTDGENFETIGTVEGAGTNYDVQEYSFIDESPVNGLNYYRLRQVDFDGQFENHRIVSVMMNGTKQDIQVYPNPTRGELNIVLPTTGENTIQIIDITGKIVRSYNTADEGILTLNIADLANGQYIIRIHNANSVSTALFVKTK